tara:strand:- start:13537 stop:14004 length:468 start_codon:yes stop_codon:yes gene_type:complete
MKYEIGKYTVRFKKEVDLLCTLKSYIPLGLKCSPKYVVNVSSIGNLHIEESQIEELFELEKIKEVVVEASIPKVLTPEEIMEQMRPSSNGTPVVEEKPAPHAKPRTKSVEEEPESDIHTLKKPELVELAVEKGIKGAQALKKESLIEAISEASEG